VGGDQEVGRKESAAKSKSEGFVVSALSWSVIKERA